MKNNYWPMLLLCLLICTVTNEKEKEKGPSLFNRIFRICSRMLELRWKQVVWLQKITPHIHPVFFRLVVCVRRVCYCFLPYAKRCKGDPFGSIRSLGCLCWWSWARKAHWWRRRRLFGLWSENTRPLITAMSQLMRLDVCFPLVRGWLTKGRIMACESERI